MTQAVNPTSKVPEKLVINGQEIVIKDSPEISGLIEAVRKEAHEVEKSKLYSRIEELKKAADQLALVKVVPDETATPNPINQQLDMTAIKAAIQEVVAPLINQAIKTEEMHVNDYRAKLISENQLTCIPELVVGKTKAELDEALQKSIEIRKTYGSVSQAAAPKTPEATVAPVKPDIVVNAPAPTPTPVTPPAQTTSDLPTAPNISSMSMEEFKKNRENLFKNLESLV